MSEPDETGVIVSRARIGAVPIHSMLVHFPIVCLIGALLTDIAYVASEGQVQWTNFPQWLLLFGIVTIVPAALFGMIDWFSNPARNRPPIGWWHMALNMVVAVLALFNNLVHARDGWTSVMPTGLILSVLTVIVLGVSSHLGGQLAYAHTARRSK